LGRCYKVNQLILLKISEEIFYQNYQQYFSFMPQGWLFGLLPWASNLHYYQVGLIGLAGSYCRSLHYVVNRQ
jgi:hypothetical protein